MAAEDWEHIKQIFATALNVPAERRESYLLEACAARPELREPVTALLSAHYAASSSFLEPGSLLVDAPWLLRTDDRVAGRFRVLRAIARGAMGEVYEAQDERLQLRVALKAIRPQLVGDAHTSQRFKREVLVTRHIAHEGLCRVFDLIEHQAGPGSGLPDGTTVPCLTMQLLEGVSLEEWLQSHRPVPPHIAGPLLCQMADALDVLHDHGIVHRDLKPSNVMLVPDGAGQRAILTDFGLAKPLDESLYETQTTVPGGAPFFMAPELFRGDRPSAASDVYAFGLLIDEMVTDRRAFSADSLHGLMVQKLQEGPVPPSDRAHGLPDAWSETILRCLEREPGDRFRRASDACRALVQHQPWWRAFTSRRPATWLRRWKYAALAGVAATGLAGALALKAPSPMPGSRSVVVVPFSNLTGNAGNDYLATGTAGELSRRLSGIAGLTVIAPRASSFDPTAKLLATYALGGHVQEASNRLRITVRLSEAGPEAVLWSKNFEGPRDKVLELEDTIAEEAAAALTRAAAAGPQSRSIHTIAAYFGLSLPFGRAPRLPQFGTNNNEAFDAYMRGRYLFEERTLPAALSATQALKRAIDLDASFAAPYATLADLQGVFMDLHTAPHSQLLAQADDYASRAVALDPNLPDAQLALAAVRQMQARWAEAETAFKRTLELHPGFARAYRWYGGMLLQFGRADEGLKLMDRALALDPDDYPSQSAYGLSLFYANRPLQAASHLERLLARHDIIHGHLILGQVYAFLGGSTTGNAGDDYRRQALEQSAVLRAQETAASLAAGGAGARVRTDYADFVGALAWGAQGRVAEAQAFLDPLETGHAGGVVAPSFLARIYAAQGRTVEALQALSDAEEQHDRELMYLKVSPWYVHLRNEPQFRDLVQRAGLNP